MSWYRITALRFCQQNSQLLQESRVLNTPLLLTTPVKWEGGECSEDCQKVVHQVPCNRPTADQSDLLA
jgi:hypothetical protein